MTLRELAACTDARVSVPSDVIWNCVTAGASIDSRAIVADDIFVPLPGTKTDGHAYIGAVLDGGAASFCSVAFAASRKELAARPGVLVVDDPLTALSAFAAARRTSFSGPVIGVTGSNGKTTTKELIAAALSPRFRVLKTPGNLNNHIGVPLTLSRLGAQHSAAVIEMGMNHPGEIAPLAALVRPTAAVITNIGLAHLEGMGSRAGVLAEKMHIADGFTAGHLLVVDGGDPELVNAATRTGARVVRAGFGADMDVAALPGDHEAADADVVLYDGTRLALALPGLHNRHNALYALAIAEWYGVPRAEALAEMRAVSAPRGRLQVRRCGAITVIDDSYNANPSSMSAALATLRQMPGAARRVVVLGEMRELGAQSAALHADVGVAAGRCADVVIAAGAYAASMAAAARATSPANAAGTHDIETHAVADASAAGALIETLLRDGDVVLVKGSRDAHMEIVVETIVRRWGTAQEADATAVAEAFRAAEDLDSGGRH